jgi:TPR repeat protein
MKRWICIWLCLTVCATARADELATGIKAWEQRDFATAQTIFTKLANAGNPEAQLLLGEMYGYGEGVPEDAAQAERLLGQARAGGNKDAAESLNNVRQRAQRKEAIAGYLADSGGAPTLAQFGCVMPVFPEASKTQLEIKAVLAKSAEWRGCYERFAAQLAQSPAKPPAELAKLMNLVELERAGRAREQALAGAASAASAEAAAFGRASDGWYARTKQYSESMDKVTRDESARRQREIEDITARAKQAMDLYKAGK